jgi:protein-disulfide isomerase
MRTTELASKALTAVSFLCAVTVTALVVRRELVSSERPSLPEPDQVVMVPEWREYAAHGHRTGPEDATVTFVVFSDYQCPACRALEENLAILRAEFPSLAVVTRHFPLPIHNSAIAAVRASECAALQDSFYDFHRVLFADQQRIGFWDWKAFAVTAGVPDVRSFEQCASAAGPIAALARDTLAGKTLGIFATPTILINGLRMVGSPSLLRLRELIAATETNG